ncbi:MAG: MEDS domain-containing protein [Pseudomonadota bacterium]
MAQENVDTNPDLLNIKEAAALLKVSEASLRRWTNAGQLSCLRLGAKKERRFRRADLLSFMDDRKAPAANGGPARRAEVLLEGVSIEHGNHICTLYESDLGRLKWSVPFLADGLRNGDTCFLIASPPVQDEILAQVAAAYAGIAEVRAEGRLIVSEGIPDPQAMCDFVERSIVMATRSGTQSFRLIGDMTWCLRAGMTTDELIDYESRYNRTIARSFPLVSVCQYDVREFSGSAVLNALKCHEDTFSYPMARFLAT